VRHQKGKRAEHRHEYAERRPECFGPWGGVAQEPDERAIANKQRVFAKAKRAYSKYVRPVFVNGEFVVVRWIFGFDWLDGTYTQMEELAYQRWEGECIVEEKFFYDPARLTPEPVG
jgi:hypothetical protein